MSFGGWRGGRGVREVRRRLKSIVFFTYLCSMTPQSYLGGCLAVWRGYPLQAVAPKDGVSAETRNSCPVPGPGKKWRLTFRFFLYAWCPIIFLQAVDGKRQWGIRNKIMSRNLSGKDENRKHYLSKGYHTNSFESNKSDFERRHLSHLFREDGWADSRPIFERIPVRRLIEALLERIRWVGVFDLVQLLQEGVETLLLNKDSSFVNFFTKKLSINISRNPLYSSVSCSPSWFSLEKL
jgi:hypothetical protein